MIEYTGPARRWVMVDCEKREELSDDAVAETEAATIE